VIFGFNTDIKHDSTVYHVQSEAREGERLLQTQIFVRGRCIGKKAASYADLVSRPEFSEERMHEMLKYQHRSTIDDIRNGRIESAMSHVTPLDILLDEMNETSEIEALPDSGATAPPKPEPRPASRVPDLAAMLGPSLQLEFLNPDAVVANNALLLRFRVLDAGAPVLGAKLIARLTKVGDDGQEHDPVFAQNLTEGDGQGDISLAARVEDMKHAVVLVQASHGGRSAMKKFRLKAPK